MRPDNLQLPCVQPPTSSYNLQFPHGCHGHGGHVGHVCHVGHGGRCVPGGQDRTRQNYHLTFQVTFDWQLLQLLRCFSKCLHASSIFPGFIRELAAQTEKRSQYSQYSQCSE